MDKNDKIYVAGHRGLVGSAIVRALRAHDYTNLCYVTHSECDLLDIKQVEDFFKKNRPNVVVLAAARVGGIGGNSRDNAGFLNENLQIELNVINTAFKYDVQRFLFLGSSCIYPKFAQQPIKEDALLTGALEPTNEGYALAKITGMKYCQFLRYQYDVCYHSVMPCNLYGPNDNYNLEIGHVLPTLIMKFLNAKQEKLSYVTLWGDGTPLREFLHSDDLAEAVVKVLEVEDPPDIVNIGSGQEISILDLANLIKDIVGYEGELKFDASKPNGTPRKLLDNSRINAMGWRPEISLRDGIFEIVNYAKNANAIA